MWDIAIPAAANLLGGIFGANSSAKAQEAANAQNLAIARENNSFNAVQAAENRTFQAQQNQWAAAASADQASWASQVNSAEAAKNRSWQETMSNTQYQRATKDMMEAGLNPMLAVSQGGAGTPSGGQGTASGGSASGSSGSQASSSGNPHMKNTMESMPAFIQAAMNSALQVSQVDNVRADTEVKEAQKKLIQEQAGQTSSSAKNLDEQTRRVKEEVEKVKNEANLTYQQQLTEAQRYELVKAESMLKEIQQDHEKHKITNTQAQTALTKIQTFLDSMQTNKARNEQNYHGKELPSKISPALGDIGKAIGSARDAVSIGRRRGR